MTTADFATATSLLTKHGILSRAFVLLRPPFLSEEEGVFWAEQTIEFAFNAGAECCTVIPVRGGNGAMDLLKEKGLFTPPHIQSLEKVLDYGIGLKRGRVFADTWDLGLFSSCNVCRDKRITRITEINMSQRISNAVICTCSNANS